MRKTVGSFFCGVGGIDLPFRCHPEWEIVFANDFNPFSRVTYNLNFPEHPMDFGDIEKWDLEKMPKFSFLIGGFPCQAFSVAGDQKGFDDERGKLIYRVVDILKRIKPRGFLLENVSNLVTHDDGKTFETIKLLLQECGYFIDYKIMNASEFGNVPQNRNRVYIIGFKSKTRLTNFHWPEAIDRTVKISDVIDLENKLDDRYYYTYEKFPRVMECFEQVDHVVGRIYQYRRNSLRVNKSGLVPTLTANMGLGGHNVPLVYTHHGLRKLTPRECFRLQGFPESYQLPTNIAEMHLYQEAGNSVCVNIIDRIVDEINRVFGNDPKKE